MVQVGGQEDFICSNETSYGDGGNFTTSKYRLGVNQKLTNPNFSQTYRNIMGGDMKPLKRVVGEENYQFSLEWTIDSWEWLRFVTNISTETGTDPYTHTLDIPTANFNGKSFAFQRIFDSQTAYLFKGVKITQLEIRFQKGADETGFLTINASCICQDIEKVTPANIETLAENSREVFHFYTAKLTTATNEIVEINNGTYNFNWNVNAEDSRYANATLSTLIGEPIYTNLTEELSLNVNNLNEDLMDEFLARTELSGTNKLEFIYSENNKVSFNFQHMYNEGNLPSTQFGEVTKTDIVYVPIIEDIVVIDDIANY